MTTFLLDLVLGHSEQPLATSSPDNVPLHRQELLKPVYLFNSASKTTIVAFNAVLISAFILP